MSGPTKSAYSMVRRNDLARQRGFRSYAQQRQYSSKVDNRSQLAGLPPGARETRQASLDALATARREGISVARAARREGVSMDAVRWWVGDAIERRNGQWKPAPADRLFRAMHVNSDGRIVGVDVRGSRTASAISSYHSAVQHYVATGDPSRLARFAGVRVGGVELETDLDVLDEMGRRGVYDFESIYRMVD